MNSCHPVLIHFRRLRDRGRIDNLFVLSRAGKVVTVCRLTGQAHTSGWVEGRCLMAEHAVR